MTNLKMNYYYIAMLKTVYLCENEWTMLNWITNIKFNYSKQFNCMQTNEPRLVKNVTYKLFVTNHIYIYIYIYMGVCVCVCVCVCVETESGIK